MNVPQNLFHRIIKKDQNKNFVKNICKSRIFWCFWCHECIIYPLKPELVQAEPSRTEAGFFFFFVKIKLCEEVGYLYAHSNPHKARCFCNIIIKYLFFHSVISMILIYYFDAWAIIWHGIVPVFMKICTDLQEICSLWAENCFVIVSEQFCKLRS